MSICVVSRANFNYLIPTTNMVYLRHQPLSKDLKKRVIGCFVFLVHLQKMLPLGALLLCCKRLGTTGSS